jgi:hypothetical protein
MSEINNISAAMITDTQSDALRDYRIDLFDNPRNDKIRYETKNEEKR